MSTATYELRLWLPDRPGVLGQVASRIGAVRGDVIGIEILERGGGFAIDELTITLPDDQDVDDVDLVDLLIGELRQVDGVAVEDLRPVGVERRDATVAALDVAVAVAAAPPGERLAICCTELLRLLATDWAVAHRERDDVPLASAGAVPDDHWLGAFLDGTRHLDNTADGAPSDVAWAWLDDTAVALACGRHGRPFHARERQQLSRIARLLDALPR